MALRRDLTHFDARRLDRTPTGGLRIPATPTRTGVLVYRNADGTERREYRPAVEVFAKDSLASLEGAALTVNHPEDPVTPATWKDLSVGHVANASQRGGMVGVDAYVLDAGAVSKVLAKELAELSCGYTCDFDPTPGVTPEGERYDGTQRNIRYNHVALLPVGWARAGRDARLHVDSADVTLTDVSLSSGNGDQMTLEQALAALAAAQEKLGAATARADAAERDRDAQRARADQAEGRATAAETALSNARNDASDEVIAKRVAARVALEADVRVVRGDSFKCAGLADRELLVAIVGEEHKDASEDFLRGAAGFAVKAARTTVDAQANATRAAGGGSVAAPGATDELNAPSGFYAMQKRNADAYTNARKGG